ncbi:ABC transporter ATP-binding protein [Streptosporangium carneum]|uniref:ABC transporter ATP-binding protein n=1 Tax=Streptosporangium carneum TaxID=47481 RepID=UPI0022F2DB3A|nr:ABC transporter ATP-binding protein [Streptosporangium carneum]
MSALEVRAVGRSFRTRSGTVEALREVTFSAEGGEVLGLLGLNGAGKTTLIKVISTLLLPTSGSVRVDGVDVVTGTRQVRSRLSVVFGGEQGLYGRLSGRDNARFFGTLSGLDHRLLDRRAAEVIAMVALDKVADRPVETYSRGMKQRLHLAIGLMAAPKLLMLDEPSIGLDPIEADRLRRVIGELAAGSAGYRPCILLTSHYLRDIEDLADRVAILQGGKITHDLPLKELLRRAGSAAVVTVSVRGDEPVRPDGDAERSGVRLVDAQPAGAGMWTARYEVARWEPATLTELARRWPHGEIADVRVEPVGLEQVFRDLSEGAGR